MITRKRRNIAADKERLPFYDKTNIKEFTKEPIKGKAKNAKKKTDSSSILKPTLVSNVNLQCRNIINSKMPNLRNKKRTCQKEETKTVVNRAVKYKTDKLDPKLYKDVSVKLERCKDLENRLQAATVKSVRFNNQSNINNPTRPTFEKALRRRITKNYVESSLSESSCITLEKSQTNDCSKKLPVYLQNNLLNELKPKVNDPFEFVTDSPKKRRRRGKKDVDDDSSDSDSDVYDKSMHKVLKEVREKEKKKKLLNKKQIQQKDKMKNLQKEIIAAPKVNEQARNINDVAVVNVVNVPRKLTNQEIINQLTRRTKYLKQEILLTSDRNFDLKSKRDENSDDDDNDKYFGFDEEDDESDIVTMLPPSEIPPIQKTNMRRPLNNIKPINENITRQFTSLTSTPIPVTRKPNTKKSLVGNPNGKIKIISNVVLTSSKQISIAAASASSSLDSISEIIPETESSPSNKQTKSNNEPVSTKKLSSTLFGTPSLENGFRGFDNSARTVQNGSSITEKLRVYVTNNQRHFSINQTATPWRGDDLSIKRNPHLLYLKDTSLLPSYNQDMVLDSKSVEKRLARHTSIPKTNHDTNKIQTSILDFVYTGRISTQSTPVKKNHNNRTLFDEGEFSPIKNNKSNENVSSPLKSSNIINIPAKKLTDKFGIENYFGFNSPENKMVDNKRNKTRKVALKRNNKDENNALPMRVPTKILKEVQDELAEKLVENDVNDGLEISEVEAEKESKEGEDEVPYVGLFEDPKEIKPPERVYARKRTKRVRLLSVDSENEEEERPKKKRKERTPAEEEEFNKWAAQFNAMCEEVDKHNLEIV